MRLLRSIVVFAALLWKSSADLPVHCLRHQIVGEWEFELSPVVKQRSSCGHQKPDTQYNQPAIDVLTTMGPTTKLKLMVQDPDTVSLNDGVLGSWTMIYDEGFEVAVGGRVFFAFSKYEFVQDGQKGKTNVSHCGETEVGWYHDAARTRWGCYVGRKVVHEHRNSRPARLDNTVKTEASSNKKLNLAAATAFLWSDDRSDEGEANQQTSSDAEDASADLETPVAPGAAATDREPAQAATTASVADAEDDMEKVAIDFAEGDTTVVEAEEPAQPAASEQLAPEPPPTERSHRASLLADVYAAPSEYTPWVPGSAGFDKPMPPRWQQAVAESLNFLQLGWSATSYSMFRGKTPRQLNRFAGTRRHRPPARPARRGQQASSFSSFLRLGSKVRRAQWKDTIDWRQKNGKNWITPVVTQGDCGSCYAISTVHMLTARNRIKHDDTSEPTFSVTFPLQCSEYNQGCDGGYGFLQSKWAEDVGLVPEHCAPLTDNPGSCSALQDCDLGDRRYRASNHHYVGGFYGGSDHDHIKQELVTNGPLVMSFEPKEDFMYYRTGVYKSGLNKIHQEWEQVDHAVLLIGMGEDEGQPYWVLQNSWGTEWGEEGYFRMARGIDESGCESIAVAADVVEDSSNDVLDNFLASI